MIIIPLIFSTALSCTDAQGLIDNIMKSKVEYKEDLIEVIKTNTQPECYEGSERNS